MKLKLAFPKSQKETSGPDGAPPKLLKFILKFPPELIEKALNELFFEDHESHSVTYTKYIKLLRKPEKDNYNVIKSWRSISLTNSLHKLLDTIIHQRVLNLIAKTPTLENKNNFAYKKGQSCHAAFHILKDILNLTSNEKNELFMAINLDYQGAFDNISTNYLTSFLSYLNFPPNIVNYFQKLSETNCNH